MPPRLVALDDTQDIAVDKAILLVGRNSDCDILIDSRKVSRRHCCIALIRDHLVVRDLDSTNGIRINGNRQTEGSVYPGGELSIAGLRYQLAWSQPEQNPRSGPRPPEKKPADRDHGIFESCEHPVPLPEPPPGKESAKGPPPLPSPQKRPIPMELPEDWNHLSGLSSSSNGK
ncbi:MAG: FHA domain-containing protein [Gemmataceae bacterium]